jgi:hypothetical protein
MQAAKSEDLIALSQPLITYALPTTGNYRNRWSTEHLLTLDPAERPHHIP